VEVLSGSQSSAREHAADLWLVVRPNVPVCDRCKCAYGDDELHICDSIRRRLPRVVVGAGLGAAVGTIGVTIYFGFMSGSPQSGLVGIFVGGPVGAAVGAVIGLATGRFSTP
jgi:hypothetical protein